jgi:hypothetical protein
MRKRWLLRRRRRRRRMEVWGAGKGRQTLEDYLGYASGFGPQGGSLERRCGCGFGQTQREGLAGLPTFPDRKARPRFRRTTQTRHVTCAKGLRRGMQERLHRPGATARACWTQSKERTAVSVARHAEQRPAAFAEHQPTPGIERQLRVSCLRMGLHYHQTKGMQMWKVEATPTLRHPELVSIFSQPLPSNGI